MNNCAPLLAAPALDHNAVWVVIAFIFIILRFLGGIAGQGREAQKGALRPPRPAPHPQPPKDPLTDEIEKFLQEASRRRAPGGQPGSPPAAPSPAPPTPPRRVQPTPSRVRDEPIEAEVIETVEDHVRKHVPAAQSTRAGPQLGKEVADVDQRMREHLHSVFDHRLGRLSDSATAAGAAPATVPVAPAGASEPVPPDLAANLAAMLFQPEGLRQAVVLNEILNRPRY
jgi:hypothetical protein